LRTLFVSFSEVDRVKKPIAKCGIDCSTCPWGSNARMDMTVEDFEQYRDNAKRILGYMPIKTPCLTCQTPDSQIPKGSKLPNRKCLIRQCVDKAGVVNCAYCSRFPCDAVKATGGVWNRESIEKKLGASISDKEYFVFVRPFEGIRRLEAIRSSLKPEEIIEPATDSKSKLKIPDFPQNLPFSKEEILSFKAVYQLLSTIIHSSSGRRDTDTFAQRHRLESHKKHVLRFLWILGRYGKFEKEDGMHLVVNAKLYGANRGSEKTLAIWSFVRDFVFTILYEFGVRCERVALKGFKEEDLTTGTGYMRSKGWVMKMSFMKKIGDITVLNAIYNYIRRLDEKYGRKAFNHFSKGDMELLRDG
jgi:hypothetical protein